MRAGHLPLRAFDALNGTALRNFPLGGISPPLSHLPGDNDHETGLPMKIPTLLALLIAAMLGALGLIFLVM